MRQKANRRAPTEGQRGLFDAPPPPARKLEFASDHYVGPVSQATGGPLNAIEAERVSRNESIAWGGFVFQRGAVLCTAHGFDTAWVPDQGYRMTVFKGTKRDKELGRCARCKAPVVGDDPR